MVLQLDDFSSGPMELRGDNGNERLAESKPGTMAGGARFVKILSGPNPRSQPFRFDVSTKVVPTGVVTLTVGTTSTVHLGLHYGFPEDPRSSPLNLDISSFTKFVIDFDWLMTPTKVNVLYLSADGKRTAFASDVRAFATHFCQFAIDLPKVPTEVNQADPKHVTQFFVGFDTIGGISMEAVGLR